MKAMKPKEEEKKLSNEILDFFYMPLKLFTAIVTKNVISCSVYFKFIINIIIQQCCQPFNILV